jgi:uncharacterized metal-binding protein
VRAWWALAGSLHKSNCPESSGSWTNAGISFAAAGIGLFSSAGVAKVGLASGEAAIGLAGDRAGGIVAAVGVAALAPGVVAQALEDAPASSVMTAIEPR